MCLSRLWYIPSADMIQLSEQVKPAEPQVIVKSYGQHTYLEEWWNLLNLNFMQTHHFRRKFYSPNIIFSYIKVNTWRNFDFLLKKFGHKKYPHPLNPYVLA